MLDPIDVGPRPFHWSCDEYERLADLDLFHDCRVQLIEGEILDMSPQTGPQSFRWTREEYDQLAGLDLFQERRVQLIDGEIFEMSPQGDSHALLIPIIYDTLKTAFGAGFTIRPQLPLALSKVSAPEPDLAVVRGDPREQRTRPSSAVLIVEVSDSSLVFDSTRKASVYAGAGIQDYWIVNLNDGRLDVYRRPAIDAKFEFGAGFLDIRSFGRDETVSPLAAPHSFILVRDLLP